MGHATLKTLWNNISGKDRSFKFAQAGKWALYFVAIGIIAGLGSVVFHYLCQWGLHFFLDYLAGYRPPPPAGEHHLLSPTQTPLSRWVLLFQKPQF